jgi:hypothetical protein
MSRTAVTRAVAAIAAAVVAVPAVAALADPAPPRTTFLCRSVMTDAVDGHGWHHVSSPRFTQGPKAPTGFAVEAWPAMLAEFTPAKQVGIWATNGAELWYSANGGCDWSRFISQDNARTVVSDPVPVPRPALPGDDVRILGVRTGYDSLGTGRYVFTYGVDLNAGAAPIPFVAVKPPGARTPFAFAARGLPNVAYPLDLAVADAGAHCAWLLATPTSPGSGLPRQLYRSTDHGTSWSEVATQTPVEHLVAPDAEDTGCSTVIGTTATQVLRSTDGGATFGEHADVAPAATPVVAPYVTADHGALATKGSDLLVLTGKDGLDRLPAAGPLTAPTRVRQVPGTPAAVAPIDANRRGRIVVATTEGVFETDTARAGAGWRDVTPAGATPLALAAVHSGVLRYPDAYAVAGLTGDGIVLRAWPQTGVPAKYGGGGPGSGPVPPVDGDVGPIDLGKPGAGVTAVTPPAVSLALAPGQSARVPFEFDLPPRRAPVDLDFEVDTTASMQDAIDGLRTSLAAMVRSFDAALLDLRVGLGDFRDAGGNLDSSAPEDQYLYKRRARLAPPGPAFVAALDSMKASIAGGGDAKEAQTVAVTQAVTGAGYAGAAGVVTPGLDAGWDRPAATKVMVLVTDDLFHQGNGYPTIAEAAAIARAHGVRVVGLAVDRGGSHTDADLIALAKAVGTVAPAPGVDCDGDGTYDLKAGAPLVCTVVAQTSGITGVGAAITAMALAVRPRTDAAFAFRGDVATVRGVTGALAARVDRRTAQALRMTAEFGCGATDSGQDRAVAVDGTVAGVAVATSYVTIHCLAAAVPGVPRPLVAAPNAPEEPPALQNPLPLPHVNTQAQAQPQSQPQANAQSVTQTVTGVVGQEDTAPELSLAMQDTRRQQPAALLMMSALVTASAAGVWARRLRTSAATVR